MSRDAGFVNWKDLLRPFAEEVGLDVDKECDLVAVAQYYLNGKNRERSFLNQALINEFDRPGAFTPSHKIIARLRISTIWTTNYDKLIEDAFRAAKQYPDVKLRDKDIGFSRKDCAAVLYKMHGDISQPDEVIFGKEDYERYPRTHPVFQNTLTTDLLRKNFLFLGFSFDDPNLNYSLGHLCALLENKKRAHYAITRYVRRKGHKSKASGMIEYYTEPKADFEYRKRKQVLQIDDLQRYGIKTILVDRFSQVREILEVLEKVINVRPVNTRILPSEIRAIELFHELREKYPNLSESHLKDILERCTGIGIDIDHHDKP